MIQNQNRLLNEDQVQKLSLSCVYLCVFLPEQEISTFYSVLQKVIAILLIFIQFPYFPGFLNFVQPCSFTQNPRITEVQKDLQSHQIQPVIDPHLVKQTRVLSTMSSPSLDTSGYGDSTIFLCSPFQFLTTLSMIKFLLMSNITQRREAPPVSFQRNFF